jgi:hypothetical protein
VGNPIGTRGPAAVDNPLREGVEADRVEMRRDLCGNPVGHRASEEDMESIRHGNALAGLRQPIEDKWTVTVEKDKKIPLDNET